MPSLQCHFCGAPVTVGETVPRDSECESCRRDLHCCINCRHYDTHYNNSCRETMADPVEDKDRRNFCEYFSFSSEPYGGAEQQSARQTAARDKLDRLFKESGSSGSGAAGKLDSVIGRPGPTGDRSAEARAKLDALFGKTKPRKDPEAEGHEG